MRVLGIDPGLATIGIALADSVRGEAKHVRHGIIKTPAGDKLERRLLTISEDLTELINAYKPDCVAIEKLYFNKNVTTGIPVAHARGVLLMTAAKYALPIFEYSPQQVKMAVTGYGNAEKAQVMELTRQLMKLKSIPKPDDAADALALALCHIHSSTSLLSGY